MGASTATSTVRLGSSAGATPSNFLARLASDDLHELTALASTRRYQRGELVFGAGAPSSMVYFLRSGKIKIGQISLLGREVILWFCLPGEIFGLAEVVYRGERAVNAVACEPAEVLAVSQAQFRELLTRRPRIALQSMEVLSLRLRVLSEMVVNLVADDVNTRIAKLILRLSACYGTRVGDEVHLNIPLTHQEIAFMTGTTRQTVSSVLSAFKRQSVLSINNHQLRIKNEDLLSEISRGN